MDIRPIGKDLEATCAGCGEVMLLMSGDSVNFRFGPEVDLGGFSLPMPDGVLCAACHRKENADSDIKVSMKLLSMSCSECGREINIDDEFESKLDDDGGVNGFVCVECSEPWRESCK